MCINHINIVIQYTIHKNDLSQYNKLLVDIKSIMEDLGAENFSLEQFQQCKRDVLCVESFRFPSEAHFHALKDIRNDSSHSTFNKIKSLIGEREIFYVALKYEDHIQKHSTYSLKHITV